MRASNESAIQMMWTNGLPIGNAEALRPLLKTWIDGLCKAGLDIPD